VPEDGIGAAGPTTADLAGDMSTVTVDSVGSPDEKAMIQQIVGSVNADQVATHDMEPDVADLILGPMLRGTEVNFQ
jgi:hypothetical protein